MTSRQICEFGHPVGAIQEGVLGERAEARFDGAIVRIGSRLEPGGDRLGEIHLERKASITVELEEPATITDWFDSYLRPVTNLITLAAGRQAIIQKLTLGKLSGQDPDLEVELVQRWRRPDQTDPEVLVWHEFLFLLNTLPGGFATGLKRWLDLSAEMRAILTVFLAPTYAASIYEEHRFINFADACEAYHRLRKGERPEAKDAYEARVTAFVAKCPDEAEAKWVEKPLRYANRYFFPQRLQALLDDHPWLEDAVVAKPTKSFVRRVTDTRNYHTHLDETSAGKSARGFELWPLCEQLAVILEAYLLEELGFTSSEAADAIRNASRHYRAISFNRALCGLPENPKPSTPVT